MDNVSVFILIIPCHITIEITSVNLLDLQVDVNRIRAIIVHIVKFSGCISNYFIHQIWIDSACYDVLKVDEMASDECSEAVKKLKPIPLQGDTSDALTNNFLSLSIGVKQSNPGNLHPCTKTDRENHHPERISPSEFVTLQRLRSSALACRTSTTIKTSRNNGTLFDDLINSDAAEKNKVSYHSFPIAAHSLHTLWPERIARQVIIIWRTKFAI